MQKSLVDSFIVGRHARGVKAVLEGCAALGAAQMAHVLDGAYGIVGVLHDEAGSSRSRCVGITKDSSFSRINGRENVWVDRSEMGARSRCGRA